MDERDLRIQKLARANLALLAELHALKECVTCSHYGEAETHCDKFLSGYSCRDYDYEWRGVKASEEWHETQRGMRETEARVQALADEEEEAFERRMNNDTGKTS